VASISPTFTSGPPGGAPPVFPLENGDRLTRDEFERRWAAMPHLKKAELIEGMVHMAAAVRTDHHGHPHSRIMLWLSTYAIYTPGVQDADNASIQLDLDNEPQPDGFLRIARELGGQSEITQDGYTSGAPELVAEVAASSASIDLHDKLNVYRRHGVKEYVVWRVLENECDRLVRAERGAVRSAPGGSGAAAQEPRVPGALARRRRNAPPRRRSRAENAP
jgi:hypothetical protein